MRTFLVLFLFSFSWHAQAKDCDDSKFSVNEFIICLPSDTEVTYKHLEDGNSISFISETAEPLMLKIFKREPNSHTPKFQEDSDTAISTEGLNSKRCIMRRHLGMLQDGTDSIDGVIFTYSHRVEFFVIGEGVFYKQLMEHCSNGA